MSETKYTRAASELMRLLQVVSSENNQAAVEVNRQAERLEGVRRDRSAEDAARFDQVMADSAVMFERYAQGLQSTIPAFQENITTVKEGFDIHIKSEIDLNTEEGRRSWRPRTEKRRGC